jgi:hypothetical protein
MKNFKLTSAVTILIITCSSAASYAATLVNNNQGKGATVTSCTDGDPVTWVNSDGTTGTDTYGNYTCYPNGTVQPNVNLVSAEKLLRLAKPTAEAKK